MATTYQEQLEKAGVIFCSMSEAIQNHPELVQKYLGSVVPYADNSTHAELGGVFRRVFAYIPPGVRCPIELMTYFRINQADSGQFERTLIVADEGAYVSLFGGLHRADAQVNAGCTPRWWNWWRWKARRSSTARCRTGTPATRTGRAACTTSSPSGASAPAPIPRFRGRRLRPVGHHVEVPQRHFAGR